FARLSGLAQSRRGRARDQRHHPALAGPFLQAPAQRLRKAGLGAFYGREGDAALIKPGKPHISLERLDELNVALGSRKLNDVVERREPGRRGGWRLTQRR